MSGRIQSQSVNVDCDGAHCQGLFLYSESVPGPSPCVLISPTIRGRSDFEEQRGAEIVALGYSALVLDLYGTGRLEESIELKRERMNRLLADRSALERRLLAWLAAARGLPQVDPSRLAAIGYCFGGLCVLDLARSGTDVLGVCSFHAVLKPPSSAARANIRARVLVLHGWEDPLATPDAVLALGRELSDKGADWQIHAYGNTLHAFTNPAANNREAGTVYDARANRRSWAAMKGFLGELFDE